ncbi:MAG: hypothetical protein WDM91_11150 [Rhizomicrobium sp.]
MRTVEQSLGFSDIPLKAKVFFVLTLLFCGGMAGIGLYLLAMGEALL